MTSHEQDVVNSVPISDLLTNISARAFILYEENRRLKKQLIWHDLRKNPDDLPPLEKGADYVSIGVLIDRGEIVYYHFQGACWMVYDGNKIDTPRAWCEIPRFEGA